ncbi:MAG: hypothetical protein AB8B73_07550 [Ekhidna sp.]
MTKILKQQLLTIVALLLLFQFSNGQTIISESTNPQTNGVINTMKIDEANGIMYLGGDFTRAGNRVRYGGAIDNLNGDLSISHPQPDGEIKVAISDGSGGFFIAGDFNMIGETARDGLAHITSGGVVSSWNPKPNNEVLDLVVSGSTVYVGGAFTSIGGASRARIAALDATTGSATSWNPGSNGNVQQLAVDGGFVYAYSPFANFMGGESIDRLAKISTSTGAAVASWNPAPGSINDMIVDGSNLYIGGFLTDVGGVTRNRLAAIAISTGNLTSWNPNVSGTVVNSIVIHGGNLYAGGIFTAVGAQTVKNLAEIDLSTGTASTFTLTNGSSVTSLDVSGTSLYIGNFSFTIGGVTRDGIGEVDLTTDLLTSWNPGLDRAPNTMAISGSNIYLGGTSTFLLGGERRNNLAAIDLDDGSVTSWNPDSDGTVNDLELTSTSIYVAGAFDNVGGAVRDNLAEIKKADGLATAFDPDVASTVDDILLVEDLLFVGGSFTSVGGGARNRLAIYDITDGSLSSWNPNLNNAVYCLASDGSSLYVGGNFTTASGTARNRIAAYDIDTESLTSWNPGSDNRVESLATSSDGTVYAGGRFTTIGGLSRTRFASIDPSTGNANTLDIVLSWIPYAIEASTSGVVYVGGGFSTVNGVSQTGTFAFNESTGALTDWDVETQTNVFSIALSGFSVYLGGSFTSVLSESTGDFAGVSRVNGSPLSFTLSSNSIQENAAVGTTVGDVIVEDDDGDTHTYSLVTGDGDDDNTTFAIDGVSLKSKSEFDFETKNIYNIRARATDNNGNFVEEAFVINVSDVIETGTDIISISIPEQLSPADINTSNHIVNIDIGFGNDRSTITPTLEVSSGATVNPASGVTQDFTLAKTYTVTAENGFTDQDWLVFVRGYYPAQTFTVGPTGDFANIDAAFDNLVQVGISGDIVLELEDGFTDPGGSLTGGWAGQTDNTVTIRPAAGATSVSISSSGTCTLCITDIENVIFDGMDILALENTNAFGVPVNFQTTINSEAVVFRNLAISSRSGDAFSIRDVDDLLIENNSYSYGTSFQTQDARVFNIENTASDIKIIGNQITLDNQFDGAFTQIFVFSTIDDVYVYNNVVHTFPTSANSFTAFRDYGEFVHNTIVLDGSGTVGASTMIRLSQNGVGTQVSNNIVVADINNDAANITSFNAGGSLKPSWNFSNNNFYVRDADAQDYPDINIAGFYGSYDLDAILAIAPGTSFTKPVFTDQTNGDLTLAGVSLSDGSLRGAPSVDVLTDIDGVTRSTFASSKGAYETSNTVTDINSFTFTGIDGEAIIDEDNHTIDAVYLDGTDFTDISPTIGIIAGATINPTSGSSQDFTSSVAYTVTAEAGNTQGWTITIDNGNSAPTDISLDNTSIDENEAVGTLVGTLSTTDVDAGETYTYTLVSGTGSADNASFTIDGDELKSAAMFDFETNDTYSIRVNTNDGNGGDFAKELTISIDDVIEPIVWDGSAWSNITGPTTSDDVIINNTYTYFGNGSFTCKDLTINSGGFLVVNLRGTLEVNGDIVNNGAIRVTTGSSFISYDANSFSGNDIEFRRNTRYADGKYSFVGTPVAQSSTIIGSDLGTDVYKYNEVTGYGANGINRWEDASSDELIPGKGFTQANQQEIIFIGVPNTGTITHTGTYTEDTDDANEGWNLVSNPYPTAINVSDFLAANMNTSGSVYIWDDNGSNSQRGSNADYIVANGTMATSSQMDVDANRYNNHLGSSQGFFVKLNSAANTTITFTETMRREDKNEDDNFYRQAPLPIARVNLTDSEGLFKQAVVGFAEDATENKLNRTYDAQSFNALSDYGLYTMKAGRSLTLNGMTQDWETIQLQLNVKEAGKYQISVQLESYENDLYLRDNVTGEITDLRNSSYSFTSQAGIYTDRFELLSSPSDVLGLEASKVLVYAHNSILHIQQEAGETREYQLFNMHGQKLLTKSVISKEEVNLGAYAKGIYLVFDGEKTHKIILK